MPFPHLPCRSCRMGQQMGTRTKIVNTSILFRVMQLRNLYMRSSVFQLIVGKTKTEWKCHGDGSLGSRRLLRRYAWYKMCCTNRLDRAIWTTATFIDNNESWVRRLTSMVNGVPSIGVSLRMKIPVVSHSHLPLSEDLMYDFKNHAIEQHALAIMHMHLSLKGRHKADSLSSLTPPVNLLPVSCFILSCQE